MQLLQRRKLIWLPAILVAFAVRAWGQVPVKLPVVGFLGTGTASAWSQWTHAFVQRARELGWVEGHNLTIEYRWGEGREESYIHAIEEFVHRNVDVIITAGGALPIAIKATSTIPIVFALAGDPVGSGAVATLARPGGNVTGLSSQSTELTGKRLELLLEAVPRLRRIAILGNLDYPSARLEMDEAEQAARMLGIEVIAVGIRRPHEIASAFEMIHGRADAVHVSADPLVNSSRVRINTLALGDRLPTMFSFREHVEAGGLMSYGPNIPHQFRRASEMVDKILRGAKPADIPVEQPTAFDLIINLTTAKTIGLNIPRTLLARANELIE